MIEENSHVNISGRADAATSPARIKGEEPLISSNDTAQVVTVSLAGEMGRHLACKGQVVSLTAPVGQICGCEVCDHEYEPEPEEDDTEDWDWAIERELEDAHFAEGWS
jgi:hypothetical protein